MLVLTRDLDFIEDAFSIVQAMRRFLSGSRLPASYLVGGCMYQVWVRLCARFLSMTIVACVKP